MASHNSAQTAPDNPFLRAVAALSTFAGWVAAAMIVAAVAITCQMILVRFVLNQSTIWQTEAVIYLMIAATLMGLPYVQRLRGHVNVDLLPLMLPRGLRKSLAVLVYLAGIVIIAVMLFYGFEFWHEAWSRNWKSDTVWGVRLWIPYSALPIGFALYLLQLLSDLIALLKDVDTPFGLEENR